MITDISIEFERRFTLLIEDTYKAFIEQTDSLMDESDKAILERICLWAIDKEHRLKERELNE